jgi:hypothetical protein
MEYYFTLKGKEILLYAVTWMNLENIMLIEIRHSFIHRTNNAWWFPGARRKRKWQIV